jgi:deoxyribodipyrimidine photo-lyase
MKNINSYRVFKQNNNEPRKEGDFVLYWMQSTRRFHYNYALEYAVSWANKLGKPLLIFEAFSCHYRWATDRSHTFMMQGMKEHLDFAEAHDLNYISFCEKEPGQIDEMFMEICDRVSIVVSDEFPIFIIKKSNEKYSRKVEIPYITVDSNGIIPLGVSDKDPYSAYFFRKIMQKHFVEAYTHPPKENPLDELEHTEEIQDLSKITDKYPDGKEALNDISSFISELDIDHSVKPIDWEGTRKAGLGMLGQFISNGLQEYGAKRNDPDEKKTSQLSAWLHFGKLSVFEIVRALFEHQPEDWSLDKITYNNGSRSGFFNGDSNISKFLDELITWREVGFHFAHHRSDYDQFDSLPDWACDTLNEHRDDIRKWNYSYDELAEAKTHDELWNAAQTQLREEGIIHNYLRMLWGKKVIEWTPDPETALTYLIDLNNTYAIDGRDPNSYSGIFWCFGRFDRAWQERPIFGKIRYMTSESTRKKVKIDQYLDHYGTQTKLL